MNYKKKEIQFSYVRYADDWLLLTNSHIEFANTLKELIKDWLFNNLALTLSESKTKITDISRRPQNPARFLGFSITITNSRKAIKKPSNSNIQIKYLQRVAGWNIQVTPDYERIFTRLERDGFSNNKLYALCKNAWTVLPDFEIVGRYNQKILGLYNYYQPMCNRKDKLNRIHYILYYSCLFTLARKKNTKISTLFNKDKQVCINFDARYQTFFPFVTQPEQEKKKLKKLLNQQKSGIDINIEKNQFTKTITLPKQTEFVKKVNHIISNNYTIIRQNIRIPKFRFSNNPVEYLDNYFINWRTSKKLTSHSCICGSINQVELHHIKHINKGKVIGFAQVLKQLNRRQIPVCKACHIKIHNAEYDGIKLSDFYDPAFVIL